MQLNTIVSQIVWDVQPEIIEGFHVRWYGLLFAVGFLGAYYILTYVFKKENQSIKLLDSLTMYAFVGLIIGLRLGHCFFYEPTYYLSHPIEILFIWKGGLASHGGAIGLIAALILFTRKYKVDIMWVLSRAAIVVPLTGALVRIGNLMNSEIYGVVSDVPWSFIFVNDGETLPRHPTQLYEALVYFAIFGIQIWYYLKSSKRGRTSNYLLLSMGIGFIFIARFFIEFLKKEQVAFEKDMTLDMGQLLSIPFILFALFLLYRHFKSEQTAKK